MNRLTKPLLTSLTLFVISACGGGGGGDSAIPNTPPVADAGRDLNALNKALVVLDGSKSRDDNGDSLTYNWSLVKKPAGSIATLSNATSVTPTFSTDLPGTYTANLVVNDGIDSSLTDEVVITALSSTSHIYDTGQNECYNNTAEITCPKSGEAFYGQDAHYSTNPLVFGGGDTTVEDYTASLLWQKADDGNKYNWYQAMGIVDAAYNPGGSTDVCGSLYLNGMFGWRLPSRRELIGLMNINEAFGIGLADSTYFQSTGTDYWSSTTQQGAPYAAWRVEGGRVDLNPKGTFASYVRCVNGALPPNLDFYVDNGDGTVTHKMSDLIWQQDGGGTARNWEEALAHCENLTFAGSSDWRLPDIKELESLVNINLSDETFVTPAVDTVYFPTTQNNDYWSSTASTHSLNTAWSVSFSYGFVHANDQRTSFKFTRCVR